MSRIHELIQRYCPAGVVFKPIADVTVRGSNIKWSAAGKREFQYIDLTSVDRVTKKIGATATISADDAPSRAQQIVHEGDVIFATTRPTQMRWAVIPSAFDGQIASTGYCLLRPIQEVVLTKYLAHLLGAERFRKYVEEKQVPGNYPSIPDSLVRAFKIPVPPMAVQEEIVRVLDTFSSLEAELEAELEARRIQYTFYRDSLVAKYAAKRVLMGDIGKFKRGRRFTKQDVVDNGIPAIHYGEIYTHYGVATESTVSHVRPDMSGQLCFAQPGDVVIATVGETVEDVAKAVAWIGNEPVAIHDDTCLFRSDLNPKYVAYAMQTADFHAQKNKHVARAKVKRISGESLAKIAIPVPSREEQAHIIRILDRFDVLVNDLSTGLPAELIARRSQYEYYRDRLLTFQEAA